MPSKKPKKNDADVFSDLLLTEMIGAKKSLKNIEIIMATEHALSLFVKKYLTKEIKPVKLTNR